MQVFTKRNHRVSAEQAYLNVIDLGILAEAHLEGAYHFKDNDKLER